MHVATMTDLSERWVDGRPELRRRSTVGTSPADGARASGSSLLDAGTGVVTSHEQPVQPEGESEQQTIG